MKKRNNKKKQTGKDVVKFLSDLKKCFAKEFPGLEMHVVKPKQ